MSGGLPRNTLEYIRQWICLDEIGGKPIYYYDTLFEEVLEKEFFDSDTAIEYCYKTCEEHGFTITTEKVSQQVSVVVANFR